jgi:peptidoglycan/LPS O-acetylase OafA/YrhL
MVIKEESTHQKLQNGFSLGTGNLKFLSLIFMMSFMSFTVFDIYTVFFIKNLIISGPVLLVLKILSLTAAALLLILIFKKLEKTPAPHITVPKESSFKTTDLSDPLLVLRFFAFFCVFVTHCIINNQINIAGLHIPGKYFLYGCAHSGMTVFFTLSGFLMGKAFYSGRYKIAAGGIQSFYGNRALRIIPLYIFASFVVSILVYPEILQTRELYKFWRLLTFNYYGLDGRPIGALWSLTTEMQYYLLAPFIFILLKDTLKSRSITFIIMAFVSVAGLSLRYILYLHNTDWYIHRYSPLYINLDVFLTGFFINSLISSKKAEFSIKAAKNDRYINITAVILLLVFIFVFATSWEYGGNLFDYISAVTNEHTWLLNSFSGFKNEFLPTLIMLLTAVCIYNIEMYKIKARLFPTTSRSFSAKMFKRFSNSLEFLGVLTYSFYVWHPAILIGFGKLYTQTGSIHIYLGRCLHAFIILLLLSYITYMLIEKPFEKMKHFK